MDKDDFPQNLSKPLQIMWFDADDFIIIVIFIVLYITIGGKFIIATVITPIVYIKIKKRYSSSFLIHLFYFTGFKEFKYYPSAFENEFHE